MRLLTVEESLASAGLEAQLSALPNYIEALKAAPAVVAFYCGDLAGNYFLARRLLDEEDRQRSEAPAATHYLAITDIFEALTASYRPYKPAKTLSQSPEIMKKRPRRVISTRIGSASSWVRGPACAT